MHRFLAHAATAALCAGWLVASAGYVQADDASTSSTANLPTSLDGEIKRAHELRLQGNYKEAAHSLAQIMLVAPDDVRVIGEYGKVLVQQGYAKNAIALLSHAVQMSANDWTLYSALGVAYDQVDDHIDARKAYDRALAIRPGEPSVLNNYAVSRMLTGDYDGAAQTLGQLQANGASDPKIAANLARADDLGSSKVVATSTPASSAPAANRKTAPVEVANAAPVPMAPKPAAARVVMEKVPFDPLAGPVGRATHAPRALPGLAHNPHPKAPVAVAAARPKTSADDIMMQEVPKDPFAGPVALRKAPTSTHAPVSNPAKPSAAKAKPELAKATTKTPAAPALRTASD